ncbi:unnamed protein product [Nesidiocoris tenuis]|uniref:Uncharacterized protein n=1 Tax=Nesidiocoris tenuis TaxID=355587 RepID=A0A6H5GII1_9HEMI|nr:unnamed protein product [Nesidiocoris tenuis]
MVTFRVNKPRTTVDLERETGGRLKYSIKSVHMHDKRIGPRHLRRCFPQARSERGKRSLRRGGPSGLMNYG